MGFESLPGLVARLGAREDRPDAIGEVGDGPPRAASLHEVSRFAGELAAALRVYGLEPGQTAAVYCRTVHEAIHAELAVSIAAGVVLSVDPDAETDRVRDALSSTRARMILVSHPDLLARLQEIRPDLPDLELAFLFHRGSLGVAAARSVHEAVAVGRDALNRDPSLHERTPSDPTSGTTAYRMVLPGRAETVPLRHTTVSAAASALAAGLELKPDDRVLVCLPVAEPAMRAVALGGLHRGASVWTGPPGVPVWDGMAAVRPTVLVLPTQAVAGFRQAIEEAASAWPRRSLFRWAQERGRIRAEPALAEGKFPSARSWSWRLARILVLDRLRAKAGGRLRLVLAVGEGLDPADMVGLHAAGFPVVDGWGPPETCGVLALNRPDALRLGTVGRPVPGAEVRIGPDGSIRVHGEFAPDPEGTDTRRRGEKTPDGFVRLLAPDRDDNRPAV